MEFITNSSPFGSRTRTRTLAALALLRQSYPRELSRLMGASLTAVRKALASLERDALVAGRAVGRTRVYELNPSYFARTELKALASKLAATDDDLRARIAQLRRRPRRMAKPL